MTSEIRVNKINNRAGLCTITIADTGVVVNGIVTCTEVSGLNVLNIAGGSTFANTLDINGDIDVDGHTNLDNLSVAGVTTITNSGGLADFKAIELEKSGTSGASRINFLENGTIRGSLTYSHDKNGVEPETTIPLANVFSDASIVVFLSP